MDAAIQSTSDDAARAKEATVRAGYYEDPFVSPLASSSVSSLPLPLPLPLPPPSSSSPSSSSLSRPTTAVNGPETRGGGQCREHHNHHHHHFPAPRPRLVQPIIKRGTYARVLCMDRAITSFLRLSLSSKDNRRCCCQVVVLGAGKDTSYFRYRNRILHGLKREEHGGDSRSLLHRSMIRWYDVDHRAVMCDKAATIGREPVFESRVVQRSERCYECTWNRPSAPAAGAGGDERYFLLSFDLRQSASNLRDELAQHDFDANAPTLFISECLQMYLPDSASLSLLRGVSTMVAPSCAYLAMYEPILGADSFGRVMESNLMGARMVAHDSCLIQTRSLSQHLSKLVESGFRCATGCDMWTAYETVLSDDQRQQANRCEFLDELEEFILIMRHYCLIVASNDSGGGGGAAFCSVGSTSLMGFVGGRSETIGT